jgi:hypothetical protein
MCSAFFRSLIVFGATIHADMENHAPKPWMEGRETPVFMEPLEDSSRLSFRILWRDLVGSVESSVSWWMATMLTIRTPKATLVNCSCHCNLLPFGRFLWRLLRGSV